MENKIIMCEQGKLEIDSNDVTDIVIFPLGHHDIVAGGSNGQPTPLSVDIDKETFDIVRSNTLSINKDFSKMWSDFSHSGGTVTGYLQDLIWDAAKGIVAKVKLTSAGIVAAKNNILNYFSPSFKIDPATNEVLSLCSNFGAMCDSPAFTALREYPITAMDKSNIYYKQLKRKTNMEVEKILEPVVEAININAANAPAIPAANAPDDIPIKTEVNASSAFDTVTQTQVLTPLLTPMITPSATNGYKMDETYLRDMIKSIINEYMSSTMMDEYMGKKGYITSIQANKAVNEAIKPINETIVEVNALQCKINDTLKVVTDNKRKEVLSPTFTDKDLIQASKQELNENFDLLNLEITKAMKERSMDYAKACQHVLVARPELWKTKQH